VAFLLVPIDYLAILQEPRDVANLSRIFVDGRLNARTAFMNYTEVNDRIDFLLNYLFSYWMLEFSIFSYFSVREVYLILNLIFYYYFSILAVFLLPGLGRVFASLVISHILVLHLFEPDTGSYLRHISSTLPYLACIMYRVSSFSRRENEFG
jgi:hypothetical protein